MEIQGPKHKLDVILHGSDLIGVIGFLGAYISYHIGILGASARITSIQKMATVNQSATRTHGGQCNAGHASETFRSERAYR